MQTQNNTPLRAAVIGSDRLAHYGNGQTSSRKIHPADLPTILAGACLMDRHSTIVVDGARVGDHERHSDWLRSSGWDHKTVGPWTLYHMRNGRTCAVGLRDEFGPRHLGVLVHQADDAGVLAMMLERYAALAGINWRGTPATTALAKIRLSWENDRTAPRWQHDKKGPGYATGPLIWSRPLSEREQSWGYVHTFDASSAYLGSAGNAELAWSTLATTGAREFDKHLPGYWHCELAPATIAWNDDPGRPPLITPARIRNGSAWLTTPMVWMLHEMGDAPTIRDSVTASERNGRRAGFRVLRQFSEQLRDARGAAEQLAGPLSDRLTYAIKRTYKDATGGLQREGMRIYRPDWAHTLIDLWRVTMLRRIIRTKEYQGSWPVAVKTDSISYADSGEWPQARGATKHYGPWCETLTDSLNVTACAVGCGCSSGSGTQLGTYKHESTATAESWGAAR